MTEDLRWLINAIMRKDTRGQNDCIRAVCAKDKTVRDKAFVEKTLEWLDELENEIKLPANCTMFTIAEKDPDINLKRYYVTEREKAVAERIEKTHRVSEIFRSKGISYRNATLLYGESGTGKTTFGRYVAKTMGLPFIYVNMSYLLDSYLGGSQKNLANLFRFVNEIECVFMIDEIDTIAVKRGAGNDVAELGRVTIALMQEMDRLDGRTILIGATNRLDIIDEAVKSRFGGNGNIHEVVRFSLEERKKYMEMFMKDIGEEYTESELERLCADTDGTLTQRIFERRMIEFVAERYYMELDKEGAEGGIPQ